METNNIPKGFDLILVFFLAILISSCVPLKKIRYLQMKEEAAERTEFMSARKVEYKVQTGDNLYIKIVSIDTKTSEMFNVYDQRFSGGGSGQDAGIYLNSYTINTEGYLDFPLIGRVLVKGLTIEEVKNKIQSELDEYIKESVVIVKPVNFFITFLGEVNSPGEYVIYQDEINFFEAVAMAGDLTDFANRRHVQLVRQTNTGTKMVFLDVTDRQFLESDYFYMMPNDIIYIEPLRGKQFAFSNFPYAIVFSAISTALLLINYFK